MYNTVYQQHSISAKWGIRVLESIDISCGLHHCQTSVVFIAEYTI